MEKSGVLDRLNPRQRKYVAGLAAGKTKKDAVLAAGYSEAENPASAIERPGVRLAFQ